jgi:hypothetical protein
MSDDAPNLLVYKANVKYLYKTETAKEEEERQR